MNPEDRARQDIDRQLGQCGWAVQDKGPMNISAALGVAVREFPMLTGEVDYLLWSVQTRAIENLERSLARNNPRSLIQMATGSGKTFTAVNACYRLIKFGGARPVLFLVDRSNLGRQTYREFQQFVSPLSQGTETGTQPVLTEPRN